MPAQVLAVELRIVDGDVLHLPEGILGRDAGVADLRIPDILEYVLAVAHQSVHADITAEHEGIGALVQRQIPDTYAVAAPEYLVGIVHCDVLDVNLAHLPKHLRSVDHRIGHLEMIGVPQRRTPSHIEIAMVDRKAVNVPEGIVALETALIRLDIAALLDGRLAGTDDDMLQTQVMGFEQRALASKLLVTDQFHIA